MRKSVHLDCCLLVTWVGSLVLCVEVIIACEFGVEALCRLRLRFRHRAKQVKRLQKEVNSKRSRKTRKEFGAVLEKVGDTRNWGAVPRPLTQREKDAYDEHRQDTIERYKKVQVEEKSQEEQQAHSTMKTKAVYDEIVAAVPRPDPYPHVEMACQFGQRCVDILKAVMLSLPAVSPPPGSSSSDSEV